jgi:uncharacterized membrane protein
MALLSATVPRGGGEPSSSSFRQRLRSILISGFALTIPIIVTLIILQFVVNFLLGAVSPLATGINEFFGTGSDVDPIVLELMALGTFLVLVFVVGTVAEFRQGDELERVFDTAMARIPGVGSVYTSFNEMTEMLLSNDTQSFEEVKLVEFPVEGSYTLAFVTADAPEEVERATDSEGMRTLFLPMAPNPVMGGYVLHVSAERVYDVDLTVEQGIRSIVTSGVATGESEGDDVEELVDLQAIRQQAADNVDDFATQARRDFASVHPERDSEEIDDDTDDSPSHYMIEENERVEGDTDRDGPETERGDSTDDATTEPASTDDSNRDSEE